MPQRVSCRITRYSRAKPSELLQSCAPKSQQLCLFFSVLYLWVLISSLLDKSHSSSKSVENYFSVRLNLLLWCCGYLFLCNKLLPNLSCLKLPFYFTQDFVGWDLGSPLLRICLWSLWCQLECLGLWSPAQMAFSLSKAGAPSSLTYFPLTSATPFSHYPPVCHAPGLRHV